MKKAIFILLSVVAQHVQGQTAFTISGSTPCSQLILSKLGMPAGTPCEYMKWKVLLDEPKGFTLTVSYGEGQPNTMLFKDGGTSRSIGGNILVQLTHSRETIYELSSPDLKSPLLLRQFDRNIFHFLDDSKKLLKGDSGHSFTLNRIN